MLNYKSNEGHKQGELNVEIRVWAEYEFSKMKLYFTYDDSIWKHIRSILDRPGWRSMIRDHDLSLNGNFALK